MVPVNAFCAFRAVTYKNRYISFLTCDRKGGWGWMIVNNLCVNKAELYQLTRFLE